MRVFGLIDGRFWGGFWGNLKLFSKKPYGSGSERAVLIETHNDLRNEAMKQLTNKNMLVCLLKARRAETVAAEVARLNVLDPDAAYEGPAYYWLKRGGVIRVAKALGLWYLVPGANPENTQDRMPPNPLEETPIIDPEDLPGVPTFLAVRRGGEIRAYNPDMRTWHDGKLVVANHKLRPGIDRIYEGVAVSWCEWKADQTAEGALNLIRKSPFLRLKLPAETVKRHRWESEKWFPAFKRRLLEVARGEWEPYDPAIMVTSEVFLALRANLRRKASAYASYVRNWNVLPYSGKVLLAASVDEVFLRLSHSGEGYLCPAFIWRGMALDLPEADPEDIAFIQSILRDSTGERESEPEADTEPAARPMPEPTPEEPQEEPENVHLEPESVEISDVEGEETTETHGIESQMPQVAPEALETCPDKGKPETANLRHSDAFNGDTQSEDPPKKITWGDFLNKGTIWKGAITDKPVSRTTIAEMVALASNDSTERIKKITGMLREIGDKKEANEFKSSYFAAWYPSICAVKTLHHGATIENVASYSGLVCLDFDGCETMEAAEDLRDDLFTEFPETLFASLSAGGKGVYVLCAVELPENANGDDYARAAHAAVQHYMRHGYAAQCADIGGSSGRVRARYLSCDEYALCREPEAEATLLTVDDKLFINDALLRKSWGDPLKRTKGNGKKWVEEALQKVAQAPDGTKDNTITSVMGTLGRLIEGYGLDAEEVYQRLRETAMLAGYDMRKTEDKIRRRMEGRL